MPASSRTSRIDWSGVISKVTPERWHHLGSPLGCTHQMTTATKVLSDMAERKQEPLRLPGRGEAFHHPFPDSGRLMGVLGPVVEVLRAAMGHRRQKLAVSGLIAGQLVGDDHPRHV